MCVCVHYTHIYMYIRSKMDLFQKRGERASNSLQPR